MPKSSRVLLNVRRFKQKPAECAIAVTASIANYFDPTVDYEDVRNMLYAREKKDGLWSSQQAQLLNDLGFSSVELVTADSDMMDFSWSNLSKARKIDKLNKKATYYLKSGDRYSRDRALHLANWLAQDDCDNTLTIDWDFAKHIRKHLNAKRPVGAAINWTTYWRKPKSFRGLSNDIRGEKEEHAVVLRGYDHVGLFVVDSHSQCYTGKLSKYKRGYYKVPWEHFLVNMPEGDLIIARP